MSQGFDDGVGGGRMGFSQFSALGWIWRRGRLLCAVVLFRFICVWVFCGPGLLRVNLSCLGESQLNHRAVGSSIES